MEAYVVFNAKQINEEYDMCQGKEVAIEAPPEIHKRGRTGTP